MDNSLSNPQPASGSSADQTHPGAGGNIPPRPPMPAQAPSQSSAGPVLPPAPPSGHDETRPFPPSYGADHRPTEPLPPYTGSAAGPAHPGGPFGPAAPTKGKDEDRPRKRSTAVAGLLVAAALIGGIAGVGGSYIGNSVWSGGGTAAAPSDPSAITVNNPGSVNEATAIAAQVTPSTVTITVSSDQGSGNGTGVVLSDDGYVLTNTHVVTLGGAASDGQIRVTGSDGTIYDAEVVGTDPIYDLAVIKLKDASGLTPIEFADSDKLNVGDTAVALGAPLGLPNTVTTGIVSALDRSIQIQSSAAPDSEDADQTPEGEGGRGGTPWFFDLPGQEEGQQGGSQESISLSVIQTDASINPGNSGGPLVNSEGKLIGINVAIATAGGSESGEGESGSVGIGFSIPANIAQRVSDEIIENGEATHGLLGASVMSSSADASATVEGATIAEAPGDGAAKDAGLREGDVITEFNGNQVRSSSDLTAQVRALAGGSTASLTYVRNGESKTAEVTLGTL